MKNYILAAVVGFFVCYILGAIFPPFVQKGRSLINIYLLNKKACWTADDSFPVELFAIQMTKLINDGYIISVSPNAEKIKIAKGDYDCKRTYLEVAQNVLEKNLGNIQYTIDKDKKVIHIKARMIDDLNKARPSYVIDKEK